MEQQNVTPIIPPIDPGIIEEELKKAIFVRETRAAKRHIYKFTDGECPQIMQEIGRLRELTFREAGGGVGQETDIDVYDTGENGTTLFTQLILWDPALKKILSAYRYALGSDIIAHGMRSPTFDLLDCSDAFLNKYLPKAIELGRSFVIPEFQADQRKGIFVFDGMMDGLASLVVDYPHIEFLFGKFTMYKGYNAKARDLILYYLKKHFGDSKELLTPKKELAIHPDETGFAELFPGQPVADRVEEKKILIKKVRDLGEDIPPLVNYYESLSPTMLFFGTADNPHFGGVEESGILLTVEDIYEEKKVRHIQTYIPNSPPE